MIDTSVAGPVAKRILEFQRRLVDIPVKETLDAMNGETEEARSTRFMATITGADLNPATIAEYLMKDHGILILAVMCYLEEKEAANKTA